MKIELPADQERGERIPPGYDQQKNLNFNWKFWRAKEEIL